MRRFVIAAALITVTTVAMAQQPAFDIVIVNGRVVDGTGAPARAGSIGIRNGLIARVGGVTAAEGSLAIDARGEVVAPGFVDVHTHADNLADRREAANFIRMGVTTIVAGNCGSSALDIGEAFQAIEGVGPAVNYATLVGHNTVRAAVMGRAQRDPSAGELRRMQALVFKAMTNGALGFSTGLQDIPGTYASSAEIIELAQVAANEGGIYATHMRNEGTALLDAVRESINVGSILQMPVQISHLKVDSPSRWGASTEALALIDTARRRGVDVEADQYAYTAGSSSLSIRFPSWALEGTSADVTARLKDLETWTRIKGEMMQLVLDRGFMDLSWATVATYQAEPAFNGRTMKEVAQEMFGGESAGQQLEAARTMMLSGGASMVYHFMSEDDVERIMRHPMVSITSDSGVVTPGSGVPHPRGMGNAARVLGLYVRERKVVSLEEAVRKMTSLPARHFGLAGRGEIRVGAAADVVVFDPATVGDTATFAAPHAYPVGISHVLVNGVPAVRKGEPLGTRSGQVLRHSQ